MIRDASQVIGRWLGSVRRKCITLTGVLLSHLLPEFQDPAFVLVLMQAYADLIQRQTGKVIQVNGLDLGEGSILGHSGSIRETPPDISMS